MFQTETDVYRDRETLRQQCIIRCRESQREPWRETDRQRQVLVQRYKIEAFENTKIHVGIDKG